VLTIRRYRDADCNDVWNLHNISLHDIGAHAGNGAWDDDLHHIEEIYLVSGGDFLVAEVDTTLVGMGALRRETDWIAEIKRMRVLPALQGQGIGTAILARLEQRAQALGFSSLVLDTATIQRPAIRLYERRGFVETGRGIKAGMDVVFFAKNLTAGDLTT
jgi:ribosomal protein S18 acetylase RimI-like enzyme